MLAVWKDPLWHLQAMEIIHVNTAAGGWLKAGRILQFVLTPQVYYAQSKDIQPLFDD